MDLDTQQKGRGQNKRFWTIEEDKALIDSLIELSTDSVWRIKNEFRGGYLNQLERMIKENIPQTMLKATPHIESRVKLLRQKTNAIADILRVDGFDWNNENNSIICERSTYDDYVKTHKKAAGLYGKSFSFYNDLNAIFTKDRALGDNRGDIGDDATQHEHGVSITMEEDMSLFQIPFDEFFMSMHEPDESLELKTLDELKMLVEAAARSAESAARTAECAIRNVEIATRNEAARAEIEEKKRSLSKVLFSIDGLTDDEAIFMLQVLAKDDDQLEVFWDLPNDKKLQFCQVFLRRMPYCPPSA